MLKTIKNKNIIKIKQIKTAFTKNFDNTLRLIYRNQKNWISIKKKIDKILKTKTKKFRKKYVTENENIYNKRKRTFYKKTNRAYYLKLQKITKKINLEFKARLNNKKKSKRHIRYSYWLTPNKKRKILQYNKFFFRPKRKYQMKKLSIAPSEYIRNIKRWTKLSEQRSKIFFDRLASSNILKLKHFATFTNYRRVLTNMNVEKYNKLHLNSKVKIKYRRLKLLRQHLLAKIPGITFKPLSKYTKPYNKLNIKQAWVAKHLAWLNIKKSNKKKFGIDFLKTILGQQFLLAHRNNSIKLLRSNRKRELHSHKVWNYYRLSNSVKARAYQAAQKRAWIYTNHVFPKRVPYFFRKTTVSNVYPYTKFRFKHTKEKQFPWLSYLLSKRNLYSGFLQPERRSLKWLQKFSWIPLLRNKIDKRQKKTKLYFYRQRLLYTWNKDTRIKTNKKARIKQLLTKSTLPFYGHLRLHQFDKLKQKAHSKKSLSLASDEIHLGYLERRLDVVVYRLNLAPNILWARKLIQDGSIFVSPSGVNKAKAFEKMYAGYKQNAYPLKLRDPQNLYKKTLWDIYWTKDKSIKTHYVKLKFLLEPLRNINYLTQPGDVILCAPGALHNKYKTNRLLWQKPIPTHLLSYSNVTETKNAFEKRTNAFKPFSRKSQKTTNVGIVLHNPKFEDLGKKDRIQKAFMRWMSL